jgi:PTH1 family peptidyl-tRNA hydrolase
MFLVVGLGNVGEKYSLTRHNVGFMLIDNALANLNSKTSINKSNFKATVFKHSETLFAQPQTFMNNSGLSVQAIKEYYKIPIENIIVIHDDLDLPFGTVKFKIGGGHGGHNGLRSIDAHIGKEYLRVRIGIGKPLNKEEVIHYVLSNFSKEELNQLQGIINHTLDAIESILNGHSMNEVKSKFTLK